MMLPALALGGLASGGCPEPRANDSGFDFNPTGTSGTEVSTGTDPSGSGSTSPDTDPGTTSADTEDSATSGNDTEDTDGGGEGAYGSIVLGETHVVGTGNTTAILTASFVPNVEATIGPDCGMDVDGCQVTMQPTCVPACVAPAVCGYDDACNPSCAGLCSLVCPEGQECYNPIPGVQACRDSETFDAGRLDFFSTMPPVTLYPPYAFPPDFMGALATPDKTITVRSTGAAGAGFDAFEAMVTTTDSMFSTFDDILPATAFGTGDLDIDWIAGQDDVTIAIVVTGSLGAESGTVTCEADDTMGAFSVPRAALDAPLATDTPLTYDISMQRTHTETTTGVPTVGTLLGEDLPAEGFVEFSYVSIETGTLTNM